MGSIHPEADSVYFSSYPKERDLVAPFLSCFDINKAFRAKRGKDEVAVYYLKPEKFMAELLGLDREMLMVYSPFPKFEARAIKLHDEAGKADRTRLDPLGSIVVSDDPDTTKTVREYLTREPERPPIVALSADELRTLTDVNMLRNLFTEQFFNRDLFALESPLRTDTTFFGRQEIVTQFIDRFRNGQNTGLFGLRRIGKTSVLYSIKRRCAEGEIGYATYVDVSSPGIYCSRWWHLLLQIVRSFAEPLDLQRSDRSKIRALNVEYTETNAAEHFKADVQRLIGQVPGNRLLLLLDEIENITFGRSPQPHWEQDALPFWQTIRSVHQDTAGSFCFVISGVNPYILECDRIGRFDNPLFSATKAYYLGPFDVASVREMVRKLARYMGIHCTEDLYQRLYDEYGGHPFLVRQACSQLIKHMKSRPGELSAQLFELEKANIAIALEQNIKQILNVLAVWYPEEYELIRILAKGDVATFVDFAKSSAEFTQHVEGYGLVSEARGQAKLRMGLVRNYLAKNVREPRHAEAAGNDEEEIRAEVSRRRNAIEQALRKVLKEGLRFSKGKKAAETALAGVSSERRSILVQYGYDQLWPELYFLELIQILDKQWTDFQNWFAEEKGKVIGWLDHINKSRADAHAKSLHPDDLAYLRVCFRRLEEKLMTT